MAARTALVRRPLSTFCSWYQPEWALMVDKANSVRIWTNTSLAGDPSSSEASASTSASSSIASTRAQPQAMRWSCAESTAATASSMSIFLAPLRRRASDLSRFDSRSSNNWTW